MTEVYEPPKVWTWEAENGGEWASLNRPLAGATHDKDLPRGEHPFQLYSLATPNGVKVNLMFEELLAAGHTSAEYDAWLIKIGDGDQFGSGFTDVNPNSKIPALMDYSGNTPVRVFESGAILLHLAQKFDAFLGKPEERAETLSWLFWQMGSAPYLGGGFGHFYHYSPKPRIKYAVDRFTMEVKRQLDVLDRNLADREWITGSEYTIADIAIWPWYGNLILGRGYNAGEFLQVHTYKNIVRWAETIDARETAKRARMVNKAMGEPHEQLHERHSAEDFLTKTQDKIGG